jgi:hypothetical protein
MEGKVINLRKEVIQKIIQKQPLGLSVAGEQIQSNIGKTIYRSTNGNHK